MSDINSRVEDLAAEIFCEYCLDSVADLVAKHFQGEAKEQERVRYFDSLYKRLDPYEGKFKSTIRKIWDEERAIIMANLRKLKAYVEKAKAEDVLYPGQKYKEKLAEEAKALFILILSQMGEEEIERLGLDIAFDLANPHVQAWIKRYPYYFAKKLEEESVDILRRILSEAFERGDTIPEIITSLREQFADWDKYRAERVARTEVIRAANQANIEAYRQAGIRQKVWMTNPGACEWCEPLDGKVIAIEENYYDLGDSIEMEIEGEKRVMNISYDEVGCPPLHPNCRCAISAWREE